MPVQGPNVRRLIIMKMSLIMVPPGSGVDTVLASMTKPGGVSDVAKQATEWVETAIAAVKAAPDNTYGDDESIAAEILRQCAARNPSICENCGGGKYHSRLGGYRCFRCSR